LVRNTFVRALNFVLQDTVEYRVQEVLQEKLAAILADFGVDKMSDVLDSAEVASDFEDLYKELSSARKELSPVLNGWKLLCGSASRK